MSDRWDRRLDILATVLLSISALATSWAGYQASLWNGDQMTFVTESANSRTQATRAATRAGLTRTVDVDLFLTWLEAHARHDTALANVLQRRFRKEFVPAFDRWWASDPLRTPGVALTPFTLPEYQLAFDDTIHHFDRVADSLMVLSLDANRRSDAFVLDAVLFATAMVFGGVAQQQQQRRSMRLILLGLAGAMCAFGLVRLMTSQSG